MSAVPRLLIFTVHKSVWGILALSLITAIGLHAGLSMAAAGFLFLLCVVIQAMRGGFWSAAIVATVAALALPFFFSPPIFSFSITKPLDAIALLTFVVVAFVAAHLAVLYRTHGKHSIQGEPTIPGNGAKNSPTSQCRFVVLLGHSGNVLAISSFLFLIYGLAWSYSTHRYLKGFADAIVPLEGSPQERTEALLAWFRHEPKRSDGLLEGSASLRDPVNIVQSARLLKICGSASNAFANLADVTGLNTRRLLLLDHSGSTMHVVAEVQWGERWVVVDPQQRRVFKDHLGRALSREELRESKVFQDAISQMPGYSPTYTFERTAHLRLRRIPWVGILLRRTLDRFSPRWEEAIDWGYFPENPSIWPLLFSLPLLLLSIFIRLVVDLYDRDELGSERSKDIYSLFKALRQKGVSESMKSA